jgi:hypothetical protein
MDEVHAIEDAQILASYPTRHGRDVVDVPFRDHGVHHLLHRPSFELEASVLLAYGFEVKVWYGPPSSFFRKVRDRVCATVAEAGE